MQTTCPPLVDRPEPGLPPLVEPVVATQESMMSSIDFSGVAFPSGPFVYAETSEDALQASPQTRRVGAKPPPSYIPRPPNAFILFRSSFIRSQNVPERGEGSNGSLSKIIGKLWHALPPDERARWEDKARAAQAEHRRRYPDWRFRLVGNSKNGGKPKGRRKGRIKDGGEDDEPPDDPGETTRGRRATRSTRSRDANAKRERDASVIGAGKGKGKAREVDDTATDESEVRHEKIPDLLVEGTSEATGGEWDGQGRGRGRARQRQQRDRDSDSSPAAVAPRRKRGKTMSSVAATTSSNPDAQDPSLSPFLHEPEPPSSPYPQSHSPYPSPGLSASASPVPGPAQVQADQRAAHGLMLPPDGPPLTHMFKRSLSAPANARTADPTSNPNRSPIPIFPPPYPSPYPPSPIPSPSSPSVSSAASTSASASPGMSMGMAYPYIQPPPIPMHRQTYPQVPQVQVQHRPRYLTVASNSGSGSNQSAGRLRPHGHGHGRRDTISLPIAPAVGTSASANVDFGVGAYASPPMYEPAGAMPQPPFATLHPETQTHYPSSRARDWWTRARGSELYDGGDSPELQAVGSPLEMDDSDRAWTDRGVGSFAEYVPVPSPSPPLPLSPYPYEYDHSSPTLPTSGPVVAEPYTLPLPLSPVSSSDTQASAGSHTSNDSPTLSSFSTLSGWAGSASGYGSAASNRTSGWYHGSLGPSPSSSTAGGGALDPSWAMAGSSKGPWAYRDHAQNRERERGDVDMQEYPSGSGGAGAGEYWGPESGSSSTI
ncbi:HMG box domain-containing protein [Mycena chlorophos]|uniref:HMG box domain-containing protein n=1 Tax=Mycena chlorophos TaxID=658473 RepID=A0A8H6RY75_MYCCL|nr:HMG box domain-containing protein [Mycena chlorophos]